MQGGEGCKAQQGNGQGRVDRKLFSSEDYSDPALLKTLNPPRPLSPPPLSGAHKGKGLGRMFLRHLRRTTALLHVVDAAATDPATDYYAVRKGVRAFGGTEGHTPFHH